MSPSARLSLEDKLLVWLTVRNKSEVSSSELTEDFMPWLIRHYGHRGCLSIHREFRKMREKKLFYCIEIPSNDKAARWKILTHRGMEWANVVQKEKRHGQDSELR